MRRPIANVGSEKCAHVDISALGLGWKQKWKGIIWPNTWGGYLVGHDDWLRVVWEGESETM